MKIFTTCAVLFFAFTASAATKRDISNLLHQAQEALLESTATPSDLDRVAQDLRNIISSLNSGSPGDGPNQECRDYAYTQYYKAYSSDVAMDKAIHACQTVEDVNVMKFLFGTYYKAYSANVAMDKAAEKSTSSLRGKVDIVEFAYTQYYKAYSSDVAADKATDRASQVRAGTLGCLQTSFDVYYKSYSADVAMDKAFIACQ